MGLMVLLMAMSIAALADEQIILGSINEKYQITGQDGKIYEIAKEDREPDLLQGIGKKVEVVGVVEKEGGKMIIRISQFSIIE